MARTLSAARRCALALLLCVGAGTAPAQQAEDSAARAFVARYAAAIVAGDTPALRQFYDPASLACINSGNRDFFDFVFNKEVAEGAALRGGYTLTQFGPIDPQLVAVNEMEGLYPNPVKATHQFQIDTPLGWHDRSLSIARMLARHEGDWFIVIGCPTAAGLAAFRRERAQGEEQAVRARELFGELRDPLLAQLKGLLARNRRIDAIKLYEASAQVDLTTAVQVVNLLEGQP